MPPAKVVCHHQAAVLSLCGPIHSSCSVLFSTTWTINLHLSLSYQLLCGDNQIRDVTLSTQVAFDLPRAVDPGVVPSITFLARHLSFLHSSSSRHAMNLAAPS